MEQRAYDHLYDPVWTAPGHDNSAGIAKHTDVSGSFRFRYCEKPLVSSLTERQPGPEIVFAAASTNSTEYTTDGTDENDSRRESVPSSRTVGCQTLYRDSEAQTDPYTPDYFVQGEGTPEIMHLSHMSFGNGIPVSDKEINRIERDRDRRVKGNALPAITDSATLELHRQFLEEQEKQDFKLREEEIDEEMTKRLEDFRSSLADRNAENEFLMEQRVETFRRKKMKDRNQELAKIQKRRTFSLRKKSSKANNHDESNSRHQSCSAKKYQQKKCERRVGMTAEDIILLENESPDLLVRASSLSDDDREKVRPSATDRKQAALIKDLQLVSNQS